MACSIGGQHFGLGINDVKMRSKLPTSLIPLGFSLLLHGH